LLPQPPDLLPQTADLLAQTAVLVTRPAASLSRLRALTGALAGTSCRGTRSCFRDGGIDVRNRGGYAPESGTYLRGPRCLNSNGI